MFVVTSTILPLDRALNPGLSGVHCWCVEIPLTLEGNPSPDLFQICIWCVVQHKLGEYLKRIFNLSKPPSGVRTSQYASSTVSGQNSVGEYHEITINRLTPSSYATPMTTNPAELHHTLSLQPPRPAERWGRMRVHTAVGCLLLSKHVAETAPTSHR